MVELKPKQTQPAKTRPRPTKTAMVFFNPVFERVVTVKEKDKNTKYVVSEWTVKLRCGHFYNQSKEQEIEKLYQPLQEGQVIRSLTVVPSGKFFNLVGFDLGSKEEPEKHDEGSSYLHLNPSYLVCLIDDVYPVDEEGLKVLRKELNKVSKKKVDLETLKERLMNFQFSNKLNLTFQQIGCGYHFLPVSYVLKLFKAGFEQFCTVVGLVYPNGDFIEFEPRPINYKTLLEKLREFGVLQTVVKGGENETF
ncbi:MAG: hypothetical protein QXS37_03170 [Candidatus Aenigmatarchaeota archaeon]